MAKKSLVARTLGRTVNEETLKADLESYRQLALEAGASASVIIPASFVSIDARVRLKCVVPRCLRAGETPNCPPYAPDLELVRQALSRFSWAVLLKCDIAPIEDYVPGKGGGKGQRQTLSFHQKIQRLSTNWKDRLTRTAIIWLWDSVAVPVRITCAKV